jgi:YVTN family beta-propeller protein
MNKHRVDRITVWMGISMILAGLTGVSLAAEAYLSPAAMVTDSRGQKLYIAEATASQIAVFDTKTQKVTATIHVPAEPTGLTLTRDGACLYVTCGGPQGMVCVIDTRTGKPLSTLPVGHTPMAPVLSPDGKFLYVCNRFNNDVCVINTQSSKQVARIPVLREPVAADITPDGKWLYVGNFLPYGPAIAHSVACKVSVINARTMALDRDIALPNGSTGLRGLIVSPDGRFVFVSHILARYTVPTTQLERGWINTNALTIIDAKAKRLMETVLLDDVDCGAANPWALACTADAKYLCVTHAGTHELSVIDLAALFDKITGAAGQAQNSGTVVSSSIPDDLSFLYGLRSRVKLVGKGPRALAVIGDKAYVAEYFTDSMTLVDLSDKSRFKTTSMPLGPAAPMTTRRRGEMLFNDASICFQSWQSCASCHPSDARPDGLNWDLLNDGIGNPKNTKSLLLAHKTPPAMITGIRRSAEVAVRAGIRHILFTVRPEEDAVAIDEYLKSLKPVPSPYLQGGKLSESARRGRALFEKAGCANCHKPPLYTDLQMHDVGTGEALDKDRRFDTPTLIEVWRTAPYLYDGRAATIEEVMTKYNPQDRHGATSNLTNDQVKDLAAFVLSQ